MPRLQTLMALLIFASSASAWAQTESATKTSGVTKSNTVLDAPIGHRQPRAGNVPPERDLSDPNNPANKEDAALDRKLKSICRGC